MNSPEPSWDWYTAVRNLEDASPELALELEGSITEEQSEGERWDTRRRVMNDCNDFASDLQFAARVIEALLPEKRPEEVS